MWTPIAKHVNIEEECPEKYVDILAKTWDVRTDKFEYKRFTDCYLDSKGEWCNGSGYKLETYGYAAVCFMKRPSLIPPDCAPDTISDHERGKNVEYKPTQPSSVSIWDKPYSPSTPLFGIRARF